MFSEKVNYIRGDHVVITFYRVNSHKDFQEFKDFEK